MEKRDRILWIAGGLLGAVSLGVAVLAALVYAGILKRFTPPPLYDPQCRREAICSAWAGLRRLHTYPYQNISVARLPDGSLALIVSELPPQLTNGELEMLVRSAFGIDFRSSERRQWPLGTDGWMEDMVIHVAPSRTGGDLFAHLLLRDRVALLYDALFGTALGAEPETAGAAMGQATAPDLRISPRELNAWLREESLRWRPADRIAEARSWPALAEEHAIGVFLSSDDKLVMLALPKRLLEQGRTDAKAMEVLRAPFRVFATATDAVFGGTWTAGGEVAILGRRRTSDPNAVAPLLFETFALLAAQSNDPLVQRFELRADTRREAGTQPVRATLSASLINTELGALLEFADAMLKSRSAMDHVQYSSFAYPKRPGSPFGNAPLAKVLNLDPNAALTARWSSSGSSALEKETTTLTANSTAALSVVYSVTGRAGGEREAALRQADEQADRYFAALRDPLLSRVAQYALLHQILHAVGSGKTAAAASLATPAIKTPTEVIVWSDGDDPVAWGGHELAATAHSEFAADARRRSRAEALQLPEGSIRRAAPVFGWRSERPDSEPAASLRKYATQRDACCSYVATDARGMTHLVEKSAVLEVGDTPSLRAALAEIGGPAVILDQPEWRLRALISADLPMLGKEIGSADVSSPPASALLYTDLGGRKSLLQLPAGQPSARTILEQIARRQTKAKWTKASTNAVATKELEPLLRQVWEPLNGKASACEVAAFGIGVIAGSMSGDLRAACEHATKAAIDHGGASPAQFLTAVASELSGDVGVGEHGRVIFFVRDGKTTTILTGVTLRTNSINRQ